MGFYTTLYLISKLFTGGGKKEEPGALFFFVGGGGVSLILLLLHKLWLVIKEARARVCVCAFSAAWPFYLHTLTGPTHQPPKKLHQWRPPPAPVPLRAGARWCRWRTTSSPSGWRPRGRTRRSGSSPSTTPSRTSKETWEGVCFFFVLWRGEVERATRGGAGFIISSFFSRVRSVVDVVHSVGVH